MAKHILYQFGRSTMELYTRLMLDMDIIRQVPLPDGPKIIAPNHPTTLDPFLVTTYMDEQIHILITESAFKVPLFGRFLRHVGHVPVVMGEGRAAFIAAERLLQDGQTVAIFPEGALSPLNGGSHKPHTGVARLALMTGAAVIPVGIGLRSERIRFMNTGIRTRDGQEEIARFYTQGPYVVTLGAPMTLNGDVEDRDYVRQSSEAIMRKFARLSNHSTYRINMKAEAEAPARKLFETAEFPAI